MPLVLDVFKYGYNIIIMLVCVNKSEKDRRAPLDHLIDANIILCDFQLNYLMTTNKCKWKYTK